MEYITREFVTTSEAAALLGVDASQVRALLRSHLLVGTRVGSQWFINKSAVAIYLGKSHDVGRPFSQRIAWSLLAAIDGEEVPWALHRQERARLVGYAQRPLAELAHRLSGRSQLARVSVGPGVFQRLAEHPNWRLGGLSGASRYDTTIIYAKASGYESLLEDTNAVVDLEQPNLLIHLVDDQWWPFDDARRGAPVWNAVAELDRFETAGEIHIAAENATY